MAPVIPLKSTHLKPVGQAGHGQSLPQKLEVQLRQFDEAMTGTRVGDKGHDHLDPVWQEKQIKESAQGMAADVQKSRASFGAGKKYRGSDSEDLLQKAVELKNLGLAGATREKSEAFIALARKFVDRNNGK